MGVNLSRIAVWLILIGLIMILIGSVCKGDSYSNGYVSGDYTYRDGYWWNGSNAYTREKYYNPTTYYYSCGYYYEQPRTYYWKYSQIPVVYKTTPATPTPTPTYSPNWQTELLSLAKQRDKFEGEMRKSSLDYQAYLAAVRELGLSGNFRWQDYGASPGFPFAGTYGYGSQVGGYNSNLQLGSYGANGNTVYGTYNTYRESYGATDLNSLYQQAARLTQGAQSLAGQATTEFNGLAGQAGDNAARVAEIIAKAKAAREVLEGVNPQPRTIERSSGTFQKSESSSTVKPMGRVDEEGANQPRANAGKFAAAQACVACHSTSGKRQEGSFRIENYSQLNKEQKAKVHERLFSTDPKYRMPPDGNLSMEQRVEFLAN